ncbi:hypothetical protein ACFFRR_002885 [Megaselia abdita]
MKYNILSLLLAFLLTSGFCEETGNGKCSSNDWSEFKKEYGKDSYNVIQDLTRMKIFCQNLKKIQVHNVLFEKGEFSWKMGVNQFTDWTEEEFKKWLGPPIKPMKFTRV